MVQAPLDYSFEDEQRVAPASRKPTAKQRERSKLATPLMVLLLPLTVLGLVCYPLLIVGSLVPVLAFVSLPTLLSLTVFLVYANAWILYLILAQRCPPTASSLPFVPFSPTRCYKIARTTFRIARDVVRSGVPSLYANLISQRVFILGGKDKHLIVKQNILYGDAGRRLDVYFPVLGPGADGALAPVLFLVGGGNWTWWSKLQGAQVALRFRRLGYVVVVPDFRQWPAVKTPGMVEDIRYALEWTGERIQAYGGDPNEIHIMAYGSGAHLTSLVVIQDAVVHSREEHYARTTPVTPKGHELEPRLDIPYSIHRLAISGARARLPRIAGMILLGGVFDVVKQARAEESAGIDELSSLRRAVGPSSAALLQSCPAHLLFNSKSLLDPSRLPPKWLLIAGGKDDQVNYSQSVLMRLLLIGVGLEEVRLRLYQEETHIGCMTSLMHGTRYSPLFIHEIEDFVDFQS